MKTSQLLIAAALALSTHWAMADAANTAEAAQTDTASPKKADDANAESPITGTPRPDGKFAKLKIGMAMDDVQEIMGSAPAKTNTYETGKRWIPFYFGSDVKRLEALYKDEGCLTFTGGNVWGSGGGELIHIEFDQTGKCYKKG